MKIQERAPYLPFGLAMAFLGLPLFAVLFDTFAVLVGKGYAFRAAGILNLFPHTAHIEAVAWFERQVETL